MIGSSENSVSYNGNGVTTAFPYSFKILEKSDLKLLLVDIGDTETLLTSDYFVDMANNTVHYPGYSPGSEPPIEEQPPILAEGQRLVIYRDVPITQETALDKHWPFNEIEAMADKLTIIAQQIDGANNRTFQLSVALADVENIDVELPYAPGKAFAWNESGTALELTENPGAVLAGVQEEAAELREFILEKQEEIDELVSRLEGIQIEELEEIRDECVRLAAEIEVALRSITNITVGNARARANWKSDYGVGSI